ncbi:MAG: calcium/sodium antiporter [Anaerolineales bacterium]|nr:calcium/sodium antiporter [Anaerolineales bacterium]MCB0009832.1 calcium/sodium antiporter [Anaerolineales bacterium]MCB0013538.1 calcium/sodium antiporter [Anaerolineales bacterium]MCB8961619.1 calcium/sodium antiporter [Ardenticatenales bacterium]
MTAGQIALNIAIVLGSILALWIGADFFVASAARIARKMGMSELVIGLTIVAMGTSAPEFAVTALAAWHGTASIPIGNVVGSNIFNLGFILGTVAIIHSISTDRNVIFRDGSILIGSTLMLLLFMWDGQLVRWEGIVMFLSLLAYLGFLMYKREYDDDEVPDGEYSWKDIPLLLGGLVLIVLGGRYLVSSSVLLAEAVGLSEWAIGVTIVAAGTSAPEAVTSIVAITRGHSQISLGNLIGSNIFNVLGVLGFAGILTPLSLGPGEYFSLVYLTIQMIITALLMRNGWQLSRREGIVLLLINGAVWIYFIMSGRAAV